MLATGGQPVGSRNKTRSSSIQLGVMRPGSQAREYDLIPGIVDLKFFKHICLSVMLYIVPQLSSAIFRTGLYRKLRFND